MISVVILKILKTENALQEKHLPQDVLQTLLEVRLVFKQLHIPMPKVHGQPAQIREEPECNLKEFQFRRQAGPEVSLGDEERERSRDAGSKIQIRPLDGEHSVQEHQRKQT